MKSSREPCRQCHRLACLATRYLVFSDPRLGAGLGEPARLVMKLQRLHHMAGEPLTIAVLAPDGAGKTTLIESLADTLRHRYTGVTRFHFLSLQLPNTVTTPVVNPHGQEPRPLLVCVAKLIYYLAYAWTIRRRHIQRAKRLGHIIILDRDVIDAAIDPTRYRLKLPDWVLSSFSKLTPRPNLTLILLADTSTILERSKELDGATLDRLLRRYERLAKHRADTVVLDANQCPEEVLSQALNAIWKTPDLPRSTNSAQHVK